MAFILLRGRMWTLSIVLVLCARGVVEAAPVGVDPEKAKGIDEVVSIKRDANSTLGGINEAYSGTTGDEVDSPDEAVVEDLSSPTLVEDVASLPLDESLTLIKRPEDVDSVSTTERDEELTGGEFATEVVSHNKNGSLTEMPLLTSEDSTDVSESTGAAADSPEAAVEDLASLTFEESQHRPEDVDSASTTEEGDEELTGAEFATEVVNRNKNGSLTERPLLTSEDSTDVSESTGAEADSPAAAVEDLASLTLEESQQKPDDVDSLSTTEERDEGLTRAEFTTEIVSGNKKVSLTEMPPLATEDSTEISEPAIFLTSIVHEGVGMTTMPAPNNSEILMELLKFLAEDADSVSTTEIDEELNRGAFTTETVSRNKNGSVTERPQLTTEDSTEISTVESAVPLTTVPAPKDPEILVNVTPNVPSTTTTSASEGSENITERTTKELFDSSTSSLASTGQLADLPTTTPATISEGEEPVEVTAEIVTTTSPLYEAFTQTPTVQLTTATRSSSLPVVATEGSSEDAIATTSNPHVNQSALQARDMASTPVSITTTSSSSPNSEVTTPEQSTEQLGDMSFSSVPTTTLMPSEMKESSEDFFEVTTVIMTTTSPLYEASTQSDQSEVQLTTTTRSSMLPVGVTEGSFEDATPVSITTTSSNSPNYEETTPIFADQATEQLGDMSLSLVPTTTLRPPEMIESSEYPVEVTTIIMTTTSPLYEASTPTPSLPLPDTTTTTTTSTAIVTSTTTDTSTITTTRPTAATILTTTIPTALITDPPTPTNTNVEIATVTTTPESSENRDLIGEVTEVTEVTEVNEVSEEPVRCAETPECVESDMSMGMMDMMEEEPRRSVINNSSIHTLIGFIVISLVILSALILTMFLTLSKCRPRRTLPEDIEKGGDNFDDRSASSGGPDSPDIPLEDQMNSVGNWIRSVHAVSGDAEQHYYAHDVGFDNPAFENDREENTDDYQSEGFVRQWESPCTGRALQTHFRMTLVSQSDAESVREAQRPLEGMNLEMLPSLTKNRARGPSKRPPSRKRNHAVTIEGLSHSAQIGQRFRAEVREASVTKGETERLQSRSVANVANDVGIINLAFVDDGEGFQDMDPNPLGMKSDALVAQQVNEDSSKNMPESCSVNPGNVGYDNLAFDHSGEYHIGSSSDIEIEVCVQETVNTKVLKLQNSPMEDEIEVVEEVTVVLSDVVDNDSSQDMPERCPVNPGISGFNNLAFVPSGVGHIARTSDVQIEMCLHETVNRKVPRFHSSPLEDEIEVLDEKRIVLSDVDDNVVQREQVVYGEDKHNQCRNVFEEDENGFLTRMLKLKSMPVKTDDPKSWNLSDSVQEQELKMGLSGKVSPRNRSMETWSLKGFGQRGVEDGVDRRNRMGEFSLSFFDMSDHSDVEEDEEYSYYPHNEEEVQSLDGEKGCLPRLFKLKSPPQKVPDVPQIEPPPMGMARSGRAPDQDVFDYTSGMDQGSYLSMELIV